MKYDWHETTVGLLIERGTIARPMDGNHGETHPTSEDFVEDGIPFITASDLRDGRLNLDGCKFITPARAASLRKGFALSGDVLLSHKATLGRVAEVPDIDQPFVVLTPQVTYYRILDHTALDRAYLRFYFRSPGFQQALRAHSTGSTRGYVSIGRQAPLPIVLPPVDEQRRIAGVLSALDDKIELNRKMNRTLEEMAQAIFKSWFVDFGDVPHSDMVDSELGPIPTGWKVVPLLEVVQLLSGGTPKTSNADFWNGDIKWASAKDVSNCQARYLVDTERMITHAGLVGSSTKVIPAGAVVVVARGATCGRWCLFGEPIAMNQTCYALVARNPAFSAYVQQLLPALFGGLVQQAHGSVFDTITTRTFDATRVAVPPARAVEQFSDAVSAIEARILDSIHESRTLGALRDALLPKLISGEIRVPEAEEAVEAAL